MVKVHKIRLIRRAPDGEREKLEVLRLDFPQVWAEANEVLLRWSQEAPRGGQVQAIRYAVFFMDGVKHEGVFDLTHWSSGMPNLTRHVQQTIDLCSGSVRPPFMSRRFFEWVLDQRPGESEHYEKLGTDYQIGDAV
jgi:hypothetical protein